MVGSVLYTQTVCLVHWLESLVRDIEKHETAYRKIRLDETKSKCQSPLERLPKRPSDIQKAEAEAAHQAWLDNLFVMDPGVNSMLTGVINKVIKF